MAVIKQTPLKDEPYYPYLVRMAEDDGYTPEDIQEVLIIPSEYMLNHSVYLTFRNGHTMKRIVHKDLLLKQATTQQEKL